MLLGLLEELSSNIKKEEEVSDCEASAAAFSSTCPAHQLVGPTTTELESINELIRFDHIYVKSEDETSSSTTTTSSTELNSNSNNHPKHSSKMVSILRPIEPKGSTDHEMTVKAPRIERPTSPASCSPAEPLGVFLGDTDLEALSDSLEAGVVDFDTMFGEFAQLQNGLDTSDTSNTSTNVIAASVNTRNTRKRTALNSVDVGKAKAKHARTENTTKINLNVEATFEPVLTTPDPAETGYMFDFDKDSVAYSSGYSSDEVCSPKPDDAGILDDSLGWEDQSFSDLFPSLV